MAKGASYQREHRKSLAKTKFSQEGLAKDTSNSVNHGQPQKKATKGEKVSAVDDRAEYEVYKLVEGKEVPVLKDGSIVTRTGKQIRDKMIYNKNREGWISKDKGRKYIIRKKK